MRLAVDRSITKLKTKVSLVTFFWFKVSFQSPGACQITRPWPYTLPPHNNNNNTLSVKQEKKSPSAGQFSLL